MRPYDCRRKRGASRSLLRGRIPGTNPPLGRGPYETDGIGGFTIERAKAVRQRGQWVSARWQDGTRDRPTGDPRDDE